MSASFTILFMTNPVGAFARTPFEQHSTAWRRSFSFVREIRMAISCCIHDDLAGAGSWTAPINSKGLLGQNRLSGKDSGEWVYEVHEDNAPCRCGCQQRVFSRESLFQCRMSLKEGGLFPIQPAHWRLKFGRVTIMLQRSPGPKPHVKA